MGIAVGKSVCPGGKKIGVGNSFTGDEVGVGANRPSRLRLLMLMSSDVQASMVTPCGILPSKITTDCVISLSSVQALSLRSSAPGKNVAEKFDVSTSSPKYRVLYSRSR